MCVTLLSKDFFEHLVAILDGYFLPFLCKTYVDNKYRIVILAFINEEAELACSRE
jgi:hypothetical protein